ncbi:MAG: hypothetical protein AAB552_02210 [Patescibacteria group bacterium]
MKTLSKAVCLFAVLVLGVAGCKSGGGSDSGPPPPVVVPTPSLELVASAPVIVGSSASVKLSWTTANVSSCSASGASGWEWEKSYTVNNSNYTLSGLNAGTTYTLNLTCMDLGEGIVSASVVVVVPIPPPIAVAASCGPGVLISRKPQGFVKVGQCNFFPENKFSSSGVVLTVSGALAPYVTEVRARGTSRNEWDFLGNPTEYVTATVVNGQASLILSNPVSSFLWQVGGVDGDFSSYIYQEVATIILEASFSEIPPFGVSDAVRDVVFTISEVKDISTEQRIVFANTFPLEVGFARIATEEAFFVRNDEIIRFDMETGKEDILTYLPLVHLSRYSEGLIVSRNGKIVFKANDSNSQKMGILDTDGAGCTADDMAGVVPLSAGCNKGLQIVSSNDCRGGMSLSPSENEIACSGVSSEGTRDILLTRISPNQVGSVTNDTYKDYSAVFSGDGREEYFTSCRPACGIFKRSIDLATGDLGPITEVITGADWHIVNWGGQELGMSLSPDGKKLVFGYSSPAKMQDFAFMHEKEILATVNTDGSGFTEIGEGSSPRWISDGRISFQQDFFFSSFFRDSSYTPVAIADADGGNQIRVMEFEGSFINTQAIIP